MDKYRTKNEIEKLLGIEVTERNGKFYYGGSLDLEGTQITSLPDNLSAGGSLDLRGTQITSLPDNLILGGYLVSDPIGSRRDKTLYHIGTDRVHCGCFGGTLDEFEDRVKEVYESGQHREEYDAFIEEAKMWREKYLNL